MMSVSEEEFLQEQSVIGDFVTLIKELVSR